MASIPKSTVDDNEPKSFNPVLLCARIEKDTDIELPNADRFQIHFCVKIGDVSVFFNREDNKPSLDLYEGARWNVRSYNRIYNKLFFRFRGAGLCYIIVESIP